ncbi:MAG: FHA domain-containing protein, partial [Candidatus Sumerlaeia bacterium]|nr:FHA domain-containing protein [Candidatus Sumerlaeia bacterium]
MLYAITLIETSGRTITQVFKNSEAEVGRSSSNHIRPDPLTHNQVSRHHASLVPGGDGTLLYTDLDSTQGSWMANQRIRGTARLRHGDVITLGKDGPRIHVTLEQGRVTGKRGTHLRQHTNSPAFPLSLSHSFVNRFDRYVRVAVGGFGEIWKTTDRETGKNLAIKLMHPSLLAPDALDEQDRDSLVARFSREARLTHLLTAGNAPSIVPVFDFGDDPQRDFLYIIMEHIEGPSLDRLIQPGNLLPPGKICRYMIDVARGLEAAHNFKWTDEHGNSSRGILHRDIKPNNIVILEKTDHAWIVD